MNRDHGGQPRGLRSELVDVDLVVVGGGIAGTCCAITAARQGIRVALVQDRPVLGGNASSEVRLWALGATSHMGNNNRWSREGGVIDEILVENTYRNSDGNPIVFDALLIDKVHSEPNLQLFLNTSVYEVEMGEQDQITAAIGFNSINSTRFEFRGSTFCDASGDGILGFLSGAAFRMGAEPRSEFGELLAPEKGHMDLLGHSLFFYSRDAGRPVRFDAPSFAKQNVTQYARFRQFNLLNHGCKLWWLEYGGRMDTIHQAEDIKFELWSLVYGIWDHVKNSGEFPEAETLTLEWVGMIPGKRESRRFEGDYMMVQQDIVEQRQHDDAVSFGGWAIDLHPADGVYSEQNACSQWHAKGVYQIPYRTMYSRNIGNLFLAGRIISATHVAFGSTRVMLTCGHNAQAVGVAAAICAEQDCLPADLAKRDRIGELQQRLLRTGQYIPGVAYNEQSDLAAAAEINVSSERSLTELQPNGEWHSLRSSRGLLLPVTAGNLPRFRFKIRGPLAEGLEVQLRLSKRLGNFTPDLTLESKIVNLASTLQVATSSSVANGAAVKAPKLARQRTSVAAGSGGTPSDHEKFPSRLPKVEFSEGWIDVDFESEIPADQHAFICLMANEKLEVAVSDEVLTGLATVMHKHDSRVNLSATQLDEPEIGIEGFEFWLPERRPQGKNLAVQFHPPLRSYSADHLTNGIARPIGKSNAWMPAADDEQPEIVLTWNQEHAITTIELDFDTDFDHPMEQVLMGHPEEVMPLCPRRIQVFGRQPDQEHLLFSISENYQTRLVVKLDKSFTTDRLRIRFGPNESGAISILGVRVF